MPCISIKREEWLHMYDDEIRAHYADTPTQELADRLGLNYWTLSRRAKRLGVSKSKEFMSSCGRRRTKITSCVMTDEMRQYIREHFAATPSIAIARQLGIDEKTVKRFARKEGLRKDKAYLAITRERGYCNKIRYSEEYLERRTRLIAETYPTAGTEELDALSKEFGIGLGMIKKIANGAGAIVDKETESAHKRAAHSLRKKYNEDFMAEFFTYFPDHTDYECSQHFGMPAKVAGQLARKHGLRKSSRHLHSVRSRRHFNIITLEPINITDMEHYFECSIRYEKTMESGLMKKVTEKYLVEAMSFTEAETRFIEEMMPYMTGEYDIPSIKRLNIAELFESQDQAADRWYKSKLTFTTIDERTGVEKKTPQTVFVRARDFDDARNTIQEGMRNTLGDWEKAAVLETTVMDVFRTKKQG